MVNNPDNPLGVVYDGCSILLTATATGLTPGVVNTAKFVIADYLDFSVDSAVFLAGSSFRPNNPPVVDEGIPNQSASVGFSFSYSIPSDAFSDADEDPLTYLATKEDNSPLPEWLTFDGTTFSGTPTGAGTLSIKVTAGDGSATAYTTFNIVITENTPIPTLTATSTPTPTPTVFNTPLPTVTPTPGGVPSTITGRVLDSNGNPLPGVVVSGGELGIAVTSNDGTYTFTNVSGGEDYTFSFHRDKYIIPSFMHSGNLAEAQDAIALKDATDAKPECGETDLTPILKKSGNYCSKLKELGLNEYVFLVSNYQEHSRVLPHAGHVRNTLLGAFLQNVKHITQLAERERKCPGRPCETTKHSKTISRYLKDIRHLNRSIITLSRLNLTVKPKRKAHNLSVVAKSRLLQRQAIKKINEYPKKTFWCE